MRPRWRSSARWGSATSVSRRTTSTAWSWSSSAGCRSMAPRRLSRYQTGIITPMAMTLRLTDAQTEALRARASREGRSMQQVALSALDEYLFRAEDDRSEEHTSELQ